MRLRGGGREPVFSSIVRSREKWDSPFGKWRCAEQKKPEVDSGPRGEGEEEEGRGTRNELSAATVDPDSVPDSVPAAAAMVSSTSSRKNSLADGLGMGNPGDCDAAKGFYAKYEPKEILGKGLSSVVRRCLCKNTGEEFAVKIMDISDKGIVDEDGLGLREQVQREAEILRRVSGHPNIVTLHDVYESRTFIFLVFELCRNGELFDLLTSKVRLSEKRVRLVMRQVLEAVAHCHALGVVHRDLKPENILLDEDFNVKLTDFGFAKVLQGGERLYEVCGTPGYLAPELLKAGMLERDECDGYGLEVDAWACGVIMYTLLVGCPPFWHRKQLTMIRLIMEARYSFSSPDWNAVTDEAKDLIAKFLVPEPARRVTVTAALNHQVFRARRGSLGSRKSSQVDLSSLQADDDVFVAQHHHGNQPEQPETAAATTRLPSAASPTPSSRAPPTVRSPPPPPPKFDARRTLRVGMTCVRFLVRFRRLRFTPEPLSLPACRDGPYSMRPFRKVIDAAAFGVYSHWVQRRAGEGQNRAALFEHFPKREVVKKNARSKNKADDDKP